MNWRNFRNIPKSDEIDVNNLEIVGNECWKYLSFSGRSFDYFLAFYRRNFRRNSTSMCKSQNLQVHRCRTEN